MFPDKTLKSTALEGVPAPFVAVVLAGGSGTRFWPRSRRSAAKQVLALAGERTMIQQTVDRIHHVCDPENVWVIANDKVAGMIRSQLPSVGVDRLLCEPAARNTAPACGLAAFLLARTEPDAVLGIFPSDHVIYDTERFAEVLRQGIALAREPETIVVLGVPPTHPETGYGYVELRAEADGEQREIPGPRAVRRFTEKPDLRTATAFLESGHYAWNSGMFLWTARTLCNALREHAPLVAGPLEAIAESFGTDRFQETFERLYPACENLSIDYAVLEPRSLKPESRIVCLPADFGWNDLGSWSALHDHHRSHSGADANNNVVESLNLTSIEAASNYVYAPGRHVALLGVQDLVVVVTGDAVLVTTRSRSQDVGRVVKELAQRGQLQLT